MSRFTIFLMWVNSRNILALNPFPYYIFRLSTKMVLSRHHRWKCLKFEIPKNNNLIVQWCIRWENLTLDDATWEDPDFIKNTFGSLSSKNTSIASSSCNTFRTWHCHVQLSMECSHIKLTVAYPAKEWKATNDPDNILFQVIQYQLFVVVTVVTVEEDLMLPCGIHFMPINSWIVAAESCFSAFVCSCLSWLRDKP